MIILEMFVSGTPITSNLVVSRWGSYWREDTKTKTLPAKRRTHWKEAIELAAKQEMAGREPVDEPVWADLTFYFNPPYKPKWPQLAVAPDLDKTERAVWDAMEKIVYVNDSRVFSKGIHKFYRQDKPGVLIQVGVLDSDGWYPKLQRCFKPTP